MSSRSTGARVDEDSKMATFGLVVQKVVDLADCTIVGNDRIALVIHVQN